MRDSTNWTSPAVNLFQYLCQSNAHTPSSPFPPLLNPGTHPFIRVDRRSWLLVDTPCISSCPFTGTASRSAPSGGVCRDFDRAKEGTDTSPNTFTVHIYRPLVRSSLTWQFHYGMHTTAVEDHDHVTQPPWKEAEASGAKPLCFLHLHHHRLSIWFPGVVFLLASPRAGRR
ncbi:hypothetical protein HDV57DRAFT_318042 [Trichoderma longibrachiatum]|uniref:Uncharacterized protein n=1 Tax=Trichoderma longibrachiatum ATCC 18648 TaxID=983965 RepID=A0A2T4BWG1_TRILO|nr:hypothetical protein M440DRAFT_1404623 [Trichoderma longibrachiatum ATCC 18648]